MWTVQKISLHKKNRPGEKSPGNSLLPPQKKWRPADGDHDKYCLCAGFPLRSLWNPWQDGLGRRAVSGVQGEEKQSGKPSAPESQTVRCVFMSAIHIRNLRSATEAAVSFVMTRAHVSSLILISFYFFLSGSHWFGSRRPKAWVTEWCGSYMETSSSVKYNNDHLYMDLCRSISRLTDSHAVCLCNNLIGQWSRLLVDGWAFAWNTLQTERHRQQNSDRLHADSCSPF